MIKIVGPKMCGETKIECRNENIISRTVRLPKTSLLKLELTIFIWRAFLFDIGMWI